jgi:hypothetical protein
MTAIEFSGIPRYSRVSRFCRGQTKEFLVCWTSGSDGGNLRAASWKSPLGILRSWEDDIKMGVTKRGIEDGSGWFWCWQRFSQLRVATLLSYLSGFLQLTLQTMPAPPHLVERGYAFSTRHCLKLRLPIWLSGLRICRPSTGDFSGRGGIKQTAK